MFVYRRVDTLSPLILGQRKVTLIYRKLNIMLICWQPGFAPWATLPVGANLQFRNPKSQCQWIILVLGKGWQVAYNHPIGSIYHLYTRYSSCLPGGYIIPTTLYKNQSNPLNRYQQWPYLKPQSPFPNPIILGIH